MATPELPSKGRTIRGALRPDTRAPLLWRPTVAAIAASFLAGWLAWLAGYRPDAAERLAHSDFSLGQQIGFDYQMLVVWKVLPAVLVAMFLVIAATFAPRKQSLPAALMAALVILATMFLAWGSVRSAWAVGPVMGLVMALGPLARRHGGVLAALAPLIAVVFFFFAVAGLAHELDAVGNVVQAGIGAGAALIVLLVLWLLRVTTGFALLQHPERPARQGAPPPFLSGGIAMRQALLIGVLLGVTAGLFAATRNHNFYWVLVTIWAITQATPDATFEKGVKRAVGVMAGCLAIGALAQVASPDVVVTVGFLTLFAGMVWWMRNYTVYIAGVTMMTVALHGDLGYRGTSFLHWAGLRLLDTVIGLIIGFGAYWLVVTLPELRRARSEQAAAHTS